MDPNRPTDFNSPSDVEIEAGVKDDIAASIKELNEAEPDAPAAPAPGDEQAATAAALKSKPADAEKPRPAEGAQPRGPDGKFVRADGSEPAAAAAPAAPEPAPPGAAPAASEAAAPSAPEHWSQLEKDRFEAFVAEAGPKAGALLLDARASLEKGYQEKFQRVAAVEKDARDLDQIFAPLESQMRLAGVNRVQAIQRLVDAHNLLTRDPQAGIEWLAKQYGADLGGVAPPANGQADPAAAPGGGEALGYLDPAAERAIKALEAHIGSLQGNIGKITQATAEQARRAQEDVQRQAQSRIEAFQSAKDAGGQLLHPYFADLRDTMADLMTPRAEGLAPIAKSIDDAYAIACRIHPEVSATLARKAEAEAAKKLAAERKADVERAKSGAQAPAASPAPAAVPRDRPAPRRDSVKADLLEVMAEARQR